MPVEQVEAIRALANERMSVAIDLAVFMDPRRGDLLALRHENLTTEGILFTHSKTGRAQLIEWLEESRAIVARAKALKPQVPGEHLLRTRAGRHYTAASFSEIWQPLVAKHVAGGGQRFRFHDLRSVSADGAAALEEARDRIGHASSETVQRFYRRGLQQGKPSR